MAEYGASIKTSDYKYYRTISYSNEDVYNPKYDVLLKLVLTKDNFNFNLANADGTDFRLLSVGGTLKMWRAHWSKPGKHAVLFFILPVIGSGRDLRMYAYWGNSIADDISDPDALGFAFYEEFPGDSISTEKWTGYTDNGSGPYGYLIKDQYQPFETIVDPFANLKSWILEAGIYADWDPVGFSSAHRSMGFEMEGTENDFYVDIFHVDKSASNAIINGGGTLTTSTKSFGGLEGRSYQDVTLIYSEPQDKITLKLFNRETYEDVEHTWSRKVEGDTRPLNLVIQGARYSSGNWGAHSNYISWLVIREDNSEVINDLDGSDLYIPYEYIEHQTVDSRPYGTDLTSVVYQHKSSFGGDPYLLSDNGYDSDINVWVSDEDATLEPYVAVTIHTGWSEDVTSTRYVHYDTGHIYHYNASKLSDNDTAFMSRNFLELTATSGWAAIKYNPSKTIGAFKIRAIDDLDYCPKEFTFYGSNFHPAINFSRAKVLVEGVFEQTEVWQSRVIPVSSLHRYYILYIHNTYGVNKNVKIQEWEMAEVFPVMEKKFPTQLRLHPSLANGLDYNFPKEFTLQGSNDSVNWDTLIPWRYTYTPFISHKTDYGKWQHYSFNNTSGYWSFRLLCRGNWEAPDNRIAIGEWSLHELAEEEYTHHILAGSSNDIKQIWANPDCGINAVRSVIFAGNDYLSRISEDKLVGSSILPDYYNDFNVV